MVLPGFAAILTDGTTVPDTVIVIVLDIAVAVEIQTAEVVITQLITSPLTKEAF